jgi:hypothetical protein
MIPHTIIQRYSLCCDSDHSCQLEEKDSWSRTNLTKAIDDVQAYSNANLRQSQLGHVCRNTYAYSNANLRQSQLGHVCRNAYAPETEPARACVS